MSDWRVRTGGQPWTLIDRRTAAEVDRVCCGRSLAVYVVLATYANSEGEDAWPMQRTIAGHLECSLRTVNRCMADLKRCRFVSTHEETHRGRQVTVYTLRTAAERMVFLDLERRASK